MDIERLLFFTSDNVTRPSNNREEKEAKKHFLEILGYHTLLNGFFIKRELLSIESLARRICESGLVNDYAQAQNEVMKLIESSDPFIKVEFNAKQVIMQYRIEKYSNNIGLNRYRVQKIS